MLAYSSNLASLRYLAYFCVLLGVPECLGLLHLLGVLECLGLLQLLDVVEVFDLLVCLGLLECLCLLLCLGLNFSYLACLRYFA